MRWKISLCWTTADQLVSSRWVEDDDFNQGKSLCDVSEGNKTQTRLVGVEISVDLWLETINRVCHISLHFLYIFISLLYLCALKYPESLITHNFSSEDWTLSPFNGHFPGESGLASVYSTNGWWKWLVTVGAISRAKLQSNHPHEQTNIQFFYRPDALPVAQPCQSTEGKNITLNGLAYRKLNQMSTQIQQPVM